MIRFQDSELQEYCRRYRSSVEEFTDPEILDVLTLFHALDDFRSIGPQERVRDIMKALAAPENRAGLKRWYEHAPAEMNKTAEVMRSALSRLVGEPLGK